MEKTCFAACAAALAAAAVGAADESWLDEVRKYEKDVLAKRG